MEHQVIKYPAAAEGGPARNENGHEVGIAAPASLSLRLQKASARSDGALAPAQGLSRTPEARVVLAASLSADLRAQWSEGLRGCVIHEVDDRAALERSVAELKPAVVFLDLALPGLGGLGGVPAIQRLHPPVKIIVLAGAPNKRQAVFALVAGARGYCDRNIRPPLIRKATEVVQRGEIWIARRVIPLLLKRLTSLARRRRVEFANGADNALGVLAPRERQIAELVGNGANNREIAARLTITEATVKAHLTSVFRKLEVPDRVRLALFLTEHKRLVG